MKEVNCEMLCERLLRKDKYFYIDAITKMMKEEHSPFIERRMFLSECDEENFILVLKHEDGDYPITIMAKDERFKKESISLLKQYYNLGKGVIVNSYTEELIKSPYFTNAFEFSDIRKYKNLVCTNINTIPYKIYPDLQVKKLTIEDKYITKDFDDDTDFDGDTIEYFFYCCVEHPEYNYGDVYGLIKDDTLLGYVACNNMFDKYWDVMYIYVPKAYRGNRYGQILTSFYAWDKLTNGCIPFYSSPRNEASAKTALNSGFRYCSKRYTTTIIRLK